MGRVIYLLFLSFILMACGAQQKSDPNVESPTDTASLAMMQSQIIGTVPLPATIKAICKDGETYTLNADDEFSLSVPTNLECYLMSEHKPLDSEKVFTTKLALVINEKISKEFKVSSEKLELGLINLAMTKESIVDKDNDGVVDNTLSIEVEAGEALLLSQTE